MQESKIDIKSTGPNVPEHQWLIRIMQELGYKNSDVTQGKGICAGVANMGIHAILLNKLEDFDEMFVALSKMVKVPKITAIKYIEAGFYSLIGKKYEWHKKYLNSIKINTAKLNAGLDIANKDGNAVNIRAFLDGVVLYQQPEEYRDILCEDPTQSLTQFSGFPLITKIISPKSHQQNSFDSTAVIKEVIPCFSGCYSQEELITYFTELSNTIKHSNYTDPVSVLISCNQHLVSVGYYNNQWIFIDINNLSIRYVQTNEEIAKEVYLAFMLSISTHLYFWLSQLNHRFEAQRVMATTIYVNHINNDVNKEHAFQILQNNIKKFKKLKIHKVTPNKIKNNRKWFSLALCHNDYPTIKKLLNHRVIPTSIDLNRAIHHKNYELTKLLLEYISPTSEHLNTAIYNKDYELTKLLLEYIPSTSQHLILVIYAEHINIELIKLLLTNTATPISEHLNSALLLKKNVELIKVLLEYIRPTSDHLSSVIYVEHVNIELIRLLLQNSATPISEHLNSALVKQNVELIKLLLEYNVTVTDEHLQTAKLFTLTEEIICLLELKLKASKPTPLIFHRECSLSIPSPTTINAVSTSSSSLDLDEPKAKKPKMNH